MHVMTPQVEVSGAEFLMSVRFLLVGTWFDLAW